jgi:hypothetical protein
LITGTATDFDFNTGVLITFGTGREEAEEEELELVVSAAIECLSSVKSSDIRENLSVEV